MNRADSAGKSAVADLLHEVAPTAGNQDRAETRAEVDAFTARPERAGPALSGAEVVPAPQPLTRRVQGDLWPVRQDPQAAAPSALDDSPPVLQPDQLADLIVAAKNAPTYLLGDNRAEQFTYTDSHEADAGSIAHEGRDARGRPIWVIDQKVTYPASPRDLAGHFLNGFFSGTALGKAGNGPKMQLLAVETAQGWRAARASENHEGKVASSPFANASIKRFVVRLSDVRPMPELGPLLNPGGMDLVVDTASVVRGKDSAEFTVHFLNPRRTAGPFPGTTDGAVRFRASREGEGKPTTVEGFYVTKAATGYVEALSDSVRPLGALQSMFETGKSLFDRSPIGWMMKPMTEAATAIATGVADAAIGATGQVFRNVAGAHARYYRKVLFPNLLGG